MKIYCQVQDLPVLFPLPWDQWYFQLWTFSLSNIFEASWEIVFYLYPHILLQFSSVQSHSRVWLFATLWTAARQGSLSITNSQSLFKLISSSHCCHPAISSFVVPVSSYFQSFPTSGSFPMSQFVVSGSQSIGVSASAPILPMDIQDWFPLWLADLISLQSKGLLKVFSDTTAQKHQFFSAQFFLCYISHIHTCLLQKP